MRTLKFCCFRSIFMQRRTVFLSALTGMIRTPGRKSLPMCVFLRRKACPAARSSLKRSSEISQRN